MYHYSGKSPALNTNFFKVNVPATRDTQSRAPIATPHVLFPFVGLKSVAQHTAIDDESVKFFIFFSFLAGGAGNILRPWTEG